MNRESLVFVGGGGHCRSCIEVVGSCGRYDMVGIIDKTEKVGTSVLGVPVIGDDESINRLATENSYSFLVSLGQIKSSTGRRRLTRYIQEAHGKNPVIIAQTAVVSQFSAIGDGTILMHRAILNAGTSLGTACIVNTGALVEHDARVGDYCHLSTMSVINGGVCLGSDCFIGSGAIVAQEVTICDGCVIGAGSVVLHSITEPGVYAGNPLKRIG